MNESLCRKYGLDEESRLNRLQVVCLDEERWVTTGNQLHDQVIQPNLNALVEGYYDFILSEPLMLEQLQGIDIPKLKTKQAAYLGTLGVNFHTEPYFEQRLRIGQAHARVNLPLSLYQSAYLHMQTLLISYVRRFIPSGHEQDNLVEFIMRIIYLDMSLASDTYHESNVEGLEKTLTELVDEKDQLVSSVNKDTLTGTASRAYILERAELEMKTHPQKPLCVIYADIDHFKAVNDTYGHAVGDDVLVTVSQRMMHELRGKDAVGRLGGEEFLILVPGVDLESAAKVAERLRERLMHSPVHSHDHTVSVTMSFGAAQWSGHETLESLMERADSALYRAKHSGRNRVECAVLEEREDQIS